MCTCRHDKKISMHTCAHVFHTMHKDNHDQQGTRTSVCPCVMDLDWCLPGGEGGKGWGGEGGEGVGGILEACLTI